MDLERIRSIVAKLPRWVLGLPAFGAGLACAVWLGVLPREMAIYGGIAAAAEMLGVFRRWSREGGEVTGGDRVEIDTREETIVDAEVSYPGEDERRMRELELEGRK